MMQRVVVVGTTGSGKSTLASALAARRDLTLIDPDALYWGANWQPVGDTIFRARVAEAVAADRWTFAGNYSSVRDLIWSRADTLIWLDYPFALIFVRLLRRTIRRIRTQENLWNTGNYETWRKQFLSRDSLFVWLLKTYQRRQREIPALLRQPEYAHLQVIHFTSARDADIWLQHVQPAIHKEHA